MENKPILYNGFKINFKATHKDANPVYLTFTVEKNGVEDMFEMKITLMEAMARSNTTHEQYVEKSIDAIKKYLDFHGIMGNQIHIFDLAGSDFLPRNE
jgi:hypothetical protein